jgi:hypothetical protein
LEYIPIDIDVSFDYEDTYGYIYIHATMPADISFTFYMMVDSSNDYFRQPDGGTIDTNHESVKVYSFNDQNYYHILPELDLSHV